MTGPRRPRAPRRTLAGLAGATALAAVLGGAPAAAQDDAISIYFVGCAAPTGFHGYLARGAAEAGENLGVDVTYIYPDQLTIPNQVQKIEEAIAAQADGIAICVFTEDAAYADVVARAKEAGIAVGSAAAPPSGATARNPDDMFLFRTGSDEGVAGRLTAQRLLVDGRHRPGRRRQPAARRRQLPVARHRADRRAEGEWRRGGVPRADDGPGPAVGGALQLPPPQSRHRGGDQHLRRDRRLPLGQGGQRARRPDPDRL